MNTDEENRTSNIQTSTNREPGETERGRKDFQPLRHRGTEFNRGIRNTRKGRRERLTTDSTDITDRKSKSKQNGAGRNIGRSEVVGSVDCVENATEIDFLGDEVADQRNFIGVAGPGLDRQIVHL